MAHPFGFVAPRRRSFAERVAEQLRFNTLPDRVSIAQDIIDSGLFGSLPEPQAVERASRIGRWRSRRADELSHSAQLLGLIHSLYDIEGAGGEGDPVALSRNEIDAAVHRFYAARTGRGFDGARAALDLARVEKEPSQQSRVLSSEAEFLWRLGWRPSPERFDWSVFDRFAAADRFGPTTGPTHLPPDLDSPLFWLGVRPEWTAGLIKTRLAAMPDGDAIHFVRGVLGATNVLRSHDLSHDHPERRGERPRYETRQQLLIRPLFDDLDRRVGDTPRNANQALQREWLRCWYLASRWFSGYFRPPEGLGARLVVAADWQLVKIRQLAARAHEPDAAACFRRDQELFWAACHALFEHAGLWKGLKALLLAFRALTVPSLASDLSHIRRHADQSDPPDPWHDLPSMLVSEFHDSLTLNTAQEADPELRGLREEFATFCLERLKSREDGTPVEPSPVWRYAYVQAIQALAVNPDKRGHRVLDHARNNDPSEEVRTSAGDAYHALISKSAPPKGRSPRRVTLEAVFWLKQAHMLALDQVIDEPGAQATREDDVRRTTRKQEGHESPDEEE